MITEKILKGALLLSLLLITAAGWAQGSEGTGPSLDPEMPGALDNLTTSVLFIKGTVFEDDNCDGFMNDDEQGLDSWPVNLLLDGREFANATTDDLGA